jgi:hypothetical protein
MRSSFWCRFATFPAIVAAALLAGCGDDDNPMKPQPPPAYAVASIPENVLANMIRAYASRDSVEYRKTLDYPDYHGVSTDQTDGTQVQFFWIDELKHIQAFAKATTIVSVYFDMGPSSSWDRLSSDDVAHPEWAVIQISGSQFLLRVDDVIQGTMTVNSSKETHIFRFKPTTPASSSATDTLWTLTQWEEVLEP